jgi:hypothetical protein
LPYTNCCPGIGSLLEVGRINLRCAIIPDVPLTGKPKWAAATALALAVSLTATSAQAQVPAQARAGAGWRISELLEGHNYLDPQAVAASGPDNAWLLGLVPDPEPSFVTQRWTGHQWVKVALPAALDGVLGPWCLYSGVYTTSPADTWFFPVLPHHGQPVQYALRWTGSAWQTSEVTASSDTVLDAAVFGPDNVWAFGEAGDSFLPIGPAVVRHWNGRSWQTATVPLGTPVDVAAVAPDDIWALGVSKATVPDQDQTVIPMHWNGARWTSPSLPTFRPVKAGYPWVPTAISATAHDVWVAETPAVNETTGESPAGLILLRWNGSAWQTMARNAQLRDVTDLTPDGHGGFWLSSIFGSDITDYRGGIFTSQPAPGAGGYVTQIAGAPGTHSFWATGRLSTGNDILRYIPQSAHTGGLDPAAYPARQPGLVYATPTTGQPGDGWAPHYLYNCG